MGFLKIFFWTFIEVERTILLPIIYLLQQFEDYVKWVALRKNDWKKSNKKKQSLKIWQFCITENRYSITENLSYQYRNFLFINTDIFH